MLHATCKRREHTIDIQYYLNLLLFLLYRFLFQHNLGVLMVSLSYTYKQIALEIKYIVKKGIRQNIHRNLTNLEKYQVGIWMHWWQGMLIDNRNL